MNTRVVGGAIATGVLAAIIVTSFLLTGSQPQPTLQQNEKLGLVILTPTTATTISELKQVYEQAASTGIGRSNVYLFWNLLEPEKERYNWENPDALMRFNKQNDLKVTLFFSIINSRTLGPLPEWMGKLGLVNLEEKAIRTLDEVLSRYDIIDYVILGGEIDAYFRENEGDLERYQKFFNTVYTQLKQKHADVKLGNSFSLQGIINHGQEDLVKTLGLGDFVAFTYRPVNNLNEISNTPSEAGKNLEKIITLTEGKKVAIMEISWSTAESVGGSEEGQAEFMKKAYEFYRDNESNFEFFTWYRQYDRPEGSCISDLNLDPGKVSIGGSIEFVLQRTADYICNAGLIDVDGNPKPAWEEIKRQTQYRTGS
ncbi:MAG: hypothetical protein ACE5JT_01770 [Nitrosopumilaceae archaeon]